MVNILQPKSFAEIESEINSILSTPWLWDIIEVTYGYYTPKNNPSIFYNNTLFKDFLKVSYDDFFRRESSYVALKTAFVWKMKWIIQRLNDVLSELEECSSIDENKKILLEKAVRYNILTLELALNWIDFELQKAGAKNEMTPEDIQKKLERNEEIETELFWWNILDNEEESVASLHFIEEALQKWENKLSEEEYKKMYDYVLKMRNTLSQKWYNLEKAGNIWNLSDNEWNNSFFQQYGKIQIPREIYCNIFQEVIDLSWLHQKVVLNTNWKGSIYDGPDFLEIPDNEMFASLPIERVMKLIAHEILGHYYNQRNHEKFFWKIRGAGNVEKEEWLAKFLEHILLWKNIDSKDVYEAPFTQIFAWEILDWSELMDFISVYSKISESKTTSEQLFYRRKRNYPLWVPWVQHKDTTYTRWLKKIINFVKNGGDIRLLFNGKFWIDDIVEKKVDFTEDSDFLFPIFVPDVIIFYMLIEKGHITNMTFTHDDFIKFLKEKYSEVFNSLNFDEVEMVTFFQKRKLSIILNDFKKILS